MSCGRLSTSLLITITSDLSTRRGYRSGSYSVLHSECVACIVVVRRSREGELRSSGGSRTSQKRQSNTTGKLDSHRVASSRSTPRSTDTLHRTPPLAWVQVPYEPSSVLRGPRTDFSAQLHSQGGSIAFTGRGPRTDFSITPQHRARCVSHTLAQLQVAGTGLGRADHDRRLIASLIRFRYRPRPSAHLPRSLATVARLASQIHLPDVTTLSQI